MFRLPHEAILRGVRKLASIKTRLYVDVFLYKQVFWHIGIDVFLFKQVFWHLWGWLHEEAETYVGCLPKYFKEPYSVFLNK
jgi:hypothetical protein